MDESQKAILLKVDKLLRLATSSNQAEAELAAEKAAEILMKYNLTQGQVEEAKREFVRENLVGKGVHNPPFEVQLVHRILTRFFAVSIVRAGFGEASLLDETAGEHYAVLGEPHNVTIALYVRTFLLRSFVELWQGYSGPKRDRDMFLSGLADGLTKKLEALQEKVKAEQQGTNALVPVADTALKRFVAQHFPKLYSGKGHRINGSSAAFNAGRAAGANISIRKSVGGGKPTFGGYLK